MKNKKNIEQLTSQNKLTQLVYNLTSNNKLSNYEADSYAYT